MYIHFISLFLTSAYNNLLYAYDFSALRHSELFSLFTGEHNRNFDILIRSTTLSGANENSNFRPLLHVHVYKELKLEH